jgi:predicted ATP-dependent protease
MPITLPASQLRTDIDPASLGFVDTSSVKSSQSWIGQSAAEQAAHLGLRLPLSHLLVVGEHGSGRTSLMLNTAQRYAASQPVAPDLIALFNFAAADKALFVRMAAGQGHVLCKELEQLIRHLAKTLPPLLAASKDEVSLHAQIANIVDGALLNIHTTCVPQLESPQVLSSYLSALKQDVLDNVEVFTPNPDNEGMLDAFLSRYRANLLVDNRASQGAPVVYDDDPSFQSLFGGYEAGGENAGNSPDFLRVRAGHLLRAHGGILLLHLRDIEADQNANAIIEKLHRVLRNQRVQIEEASGGAGQAGASHFAPEAIPVDIKLVLLVTREEYYALHENLGDFLQYFAIKVEFAEYLPALAASYQDVAQVVASLCQQYQLQPFSAAAVAKLIAFLQRQIEDQRRISTQFSSLVPVLLESNHLAQQQSLQVVDAVQVDSVLQARSQRHHYVEQQLRQSIIEGEVLVQVHGQAVGQINGLTHIDMGDTSFGAPVKISALCYAGNHGVVNIDREVKMTGPNHDKGLLILSHWLSAQFVQLTPLSLNVSLVFEQEYNGVEGDSASIAELYALLSALSGVPLRQGLAITGAMNQHGQAMVIGGVNEKIEGYYQLCRAMGLDGKQGVIIPAINQSHLTLSEEVVAAVQAGQFHIYGISHVFEGLSLLADTPINELYVDGHFLPNSLMAKAQQTLSRYQSQYQQYHFPNRT